jgi:hypothetical protein
MPVEAANPEHTLLYRYAHCRAGDKGDRLNLAVFVRDPSHYDWLLEQVTEERVAAVFNHRGVTNVRRFQMPNIHAINLVLDDVLQGGVNGALNLDGHGKSLSFLLLSLSVLPPNMGKHTLTS